MPDICDMDELQSGQRREALFSAVMVMIQKFENSLIFLSSGFILHVIGFDQNLTQQPPEVIHHLLWFGFPVLIFFSALGFLISWFIPITEKKMALVRAQLEERRRLQAAAGNPEV
jgi:GPH family glycoside/pentoside/hexuronide:cation symporter